MRALFPGHYRPQLTFAEALENAIVVFDTNALLNFYGLSESSRRRLFDLMEQLPTQRWIPHQVALEFHRNRIGLIDKNNDAYHKIPLEISGALRSIKQSCDAQDILRIEPNTARLLEAFASSGQALIEHLTDCGKALPKHSLQDEVAEKFADLFDSRVGPPPDSQEALNSLCEDGDARYESGIPPGFGDKNKKEIYLHGKLQYKAKFGDLIIWRQILAHVASQQVEAPRMLMYVTDDAKKDWWLMAGSNSLGPRPELAIELHEAAPKWSLWMYTSSRFFQELAKVQHGNLDKNIIADVEHAAMAGQLAVYEKYLDDAEDFTADLDSADEAIVRSTSKTIERAARMAERRRARECFMDWVHREYRVLRVMSAPLPAASVQVIVQASDKDDQMPTVMLFAHAYSSERATAKQLQELTHHASRMSNPVVVVLHIGSRAGVEYATPAQIMQVQLNIARAFNAKDVHHRLAEIKLSAFVPEFEVWPVSS
ncbi:PIN-like domain-containing protein [Achromobacter mucicolens]|uniref:PIN-like domain-containing protein n=1 Tax=Achromobacter mucicolens TaxID=1389922 RepID=UPI0020A4F2DD|nr:PIN-like domain-containing protein [Achromobacter mucicolens]MCP2517020.1 PIN-like domain-containing protein [Achromobacter mucicolens]